MSSDICSTTESRFALGSFFGSAVNIASMSESRISKSAPQRPATIADRRSLSPISISSVATESFSFTIGIAFISSNLANVFFAFKFFSSSRITS